MFAKLNAIVVAVVTTSVLGLVAASGALAAAHVPLKGSDAGHFEIPDACADGTAHVVINGVGNATRIGRYDFSSNECFDPVGGTFVGTPTFTAVNGDTLTGTYRGQITAVEGDVGYYTETLQITGGTGRFEGMTGTAQISGQANLKTGEYEQTLSGTLSN
jgi:hypothetical protein